MAPNAVANFAAITKEDLEFSVGSKVAVWEVKDPLLAPNPEYMDDDSQSAFRGAGGSLVGGYGGNAMYGNYQGYSKSSSYDQFNGGQEYNARY